MLNCRLVEENRENVCKTMITIWKKAKVFAVAALYLKRKFIRNAVAVVELEFLMQTETGSETLPFLCANFYNSKSKRMQWWTRVKKNFSDFFFIFQQKRELQIQSIHWIYTRRWTIAENSNLTHCWSWLYSAYNNNVQKWNIFIRECTTWNQIGKM